MPFLNIDYRDTLRKADELADLASEIRSIAQSDLPQLQSAAERSWRGSASEIYQKKVCTFSNQTRGQAKELQDLARSLKGRAQYYQYLERLGLSLFGG